MSYIYIYTYIYIYIFFFFFFEKELVDGSDQIYIY